MTFTQNRLPARVPRRATVNKDPDRSLAEPQSPCGWASQTLKPQPWAFISLFVPIRRYRVRIRNRPNRAYGTPDRRAWQTRIRSVYIVVAGVLGACLLGWRGTNTHSSEIATMANRAPLLYPQSSWSTHSPPSSQSLSCESIGIERVSSTWIPIIRRCTLVWLQIGGGEHTKWAQQWLIIRQRHR